MRSRALLAALGTVLLVLLVPLLSSTGAASASGGLPSERTWRHDVGVVMRPAIPYLDQRVARGGGQDGELAIVLDIDNTSLATHYDWPHAIARTRAFARRADALGVSVFFVTGRFVRDARAQRPVLRRAGYPVDGICGRRRGEGLVQSKTRCRQGLVDRGFTIIASVGNLPSDFKGGLFERKFDLPDYGHRLS